VRDNMFVRIGSYIHAVDSIESVHLHKDHNGRFHVKFRECATSSDVDGKYLRDLKSFLYACGVYEVKAEEE
jgi:hypothetical protein